MSAPVKIDDKDELEAKNVELEAKIVELEKWRQRAILNEEKIDELNAENAVLVDEIFELKSENAKLRWDHKSTVEDLKRKDTELENRLAKMEQRTNEATDSSPSKKSKKHIAERHPHLEKSYPGVSSDTTRISDIKEREGLHKRFCTASSTIEKTNEEHEALKKLYDEIKEQLPKEVTRNALRKKADRARKVYDLFFRIGDDKEQRMIYCTSNEPKRFLKRPFVFKRGRYQICSEPC
ncbi:11139_t:CDS:2 [Rhizophagus irregularis]|nr:11139_t:CDS:2 [Rhizophagus irregularis]